MIPRSGGEVKNAKLKIKNEKGRGSGGEFSPQRRKERKEDIIEEVIEIVTVCGPVSAATKSSSSSSSSSSSPRLLAGLPPPTGALRSYADRFPRDESRGYITAARRAQGRLASRPHTVWGAGGGGYCPYTSEGSISGAVSSCLMPDSMRPYLRAFVARLLRQILPARDAAEMLWPNRSKSACRYSFSNCSRAW